MKKDELIELLKSLGIAVNEGESSIANSKVYPRIVFWDYIWEDKVASDETYSTVETYQISFFAREPRNPALLKLRDRLREYGIHPIIQHEYIADTGKDKKYYHSFSNLEVTVENE